MVSGVSASRRRTRASAVSVAGSAEITGTASAMTSIGSCDRTIRCVALLAANSATHLIVLSHDPIDVIALAVPVISADPATETALALVRRLLALTPETI